MDEVTDFIKVYGSSGGGLAYWPASFRRAGFDKKIPYKRDSATIVLMHPKAEMGLIKASLEAMLKQFEILEKLGQPTQTGQRTEVASDG